MAQMVATAQIPPVATGSDTAIDSASQRHLADAPPSPQRQRCRVSGPSADVATASTLRILPVRSRYEPRRLPTGDEETDVAAEPPETPSLPQHECSAANCAVAKVFETAELLEAILCFLDTKDVLELRRTNKQHWNATVHSSPYLRLHFFTYRQWERPSAEYQLLPLSLPGVEIRLDEPIHLGQWIEVTITLEAAKRICPEPKQRVRSRSIH